MDSRTRKRIVGGASITLTVDESHFKQSSLFLCGSLLERFFAGYVPPTTYTELMIVNQQGLLLHQWKPREGEQSLL